ncbi:DUF4198 domain-containing protein [Spongiibacter taiwanensis]|uniref:DUF4198 domain-containing protein n=1 Tax=Spongiibacter taiwanensis TaxID=1748242 RepID=UPI0020359D3A|nr:DUF4198 domain-containing protein [Spongiibacter taiwanensis]USA44543.1 DUF4198 domain-containing protein [Spongiibacter taiwanensis]
MKRVQFYFLAVLCLQLGLPLTANAHRAWFLPAATVLSGEAPWVTVDGAVSNDIFYTDHAPLRLNELQVLAPDGSAVEAQNPHTGKHRSSFDLQLTQEGTYKIAIASSGLRARWETADGKRGGWPGRGPNATNAPFEKAVPKDAKNLEVSYSSRRIETFITAGQPSTKVFTPTGQGLEMQPITHPNDLFAGEPAKFTFLIDGKPAAGTKVTLIVDGMRYRNSQNAIELTADDKGVVSVTWPEAGRYWLEAEYQDNKAKAPATTRQGGYVATLEVLPL